MVYEFQCSRCRWVVTEPKPFHSGQTLCAACRRAILSLPPAPPPPMRASAEPHTHGVGITLVVLVFLMGVLIGTKMTGGW